MLKSNSQRYQSYDHFFILLKMFSGTFSYCSYSIWQVNSIANKARSKLYITSENSGFQSWSVSIIWERARNVPPR